MKLLATILVGLGLLVTVGFAQSGTFTAQPIQCGSLGLNPEASDLMVIKTGSPFTVPAGKILVITGVGRSTANTGNSAVHINGVSEAVVSTTFGTGSPSSPSIVALPLGLTAQAGDIVDAASSNGRVYGYLQDE